MSPADRPVLAVDLAGAVAQAGVDPTLDDRALQDALRSAIATRRGSCSWTVDHAGWVMTMHSQEEEQDFYGKTGRQDGGKPNVVRHGLRVASPTSPACWS